MQSASHDLVKPLERITRGNSDSPLFSEVIEGGPLIETGSAYAGIFLSFTILLLQTARRTATGARLLHVTKVRPRQMDLIESGTASYWSKESKREVNPRMHAPEQVDRKSVV